MGITVRPFGEGDQRWADELISAHQGSSRTVRLGELIDPLELPGLVAERDGQRLGLLTYIADGDGFEVLSLHSQVEGAGAGSALLEAAAALARRRGYRRLWLVTTNDNLHALGFYQRRGLRLCAVHVGALDRDRALKPELAAVNPDNRIPLHDLLELELPL
ncbi:MAG TPA: GNAT family N-acetyltransferase [Actinomycetota bacterium]|nr:GNAT family N-acetyltransferase [Actinomycetota bacterium]